MLSIFAIKLRAWLGIYNLTATEYINRLAKFPKAKRRGVFAAALTEASNYEYAYNLV